MMDKKIAIASYKWTSNNALYHIAPGSLFLKDRLAFVVDTILEDYNQKGSLENPNRIKDFVFKCIMERYNKRLDAKRINGHKIVLTRLFSNDIDRLTLRFIKTSEEENNHSGEFRIYPRTFVCLNNDCNKFYYFNYNGVLPLKCTCGGSLEQVSVVKFCEECGKVDELYPKCRICAKNKLEQGKMRLIRPVKDSLISWRWICSHGHKEDIFQAFCDHKDRRNNVEPDLLPKAAPSSKFQPLTIRENSIFTPVVVNTVDIKDTKNIQNIHELTLILFGIHLGEFDKFKDASDKSILQYINERYELYYSEENKNSFAAGLRSFKPDVEQDEIEKKYEEHCRIPEIKKVIDELMSHFPPEHYNHDEFNNYSALKGIFGDQLNSKKYSEILKGNDSKINEWKNFKKKFKIDEITYLERMRLVSAAIGIISGINKTDVEFSPHFDPLWEVPKWNREKFSAYVNPYDTEGILIDFNKKDIVEWLKNKFAQTIEKSGLTPEKYLISMNCNSDEYKETHTLLHTLSHVLIKKSSIHTGIDPNSCGEMVFPNMGAILIYSTSSINIGGFGHLFENYLIDLFNQSDFQLRQCIYDPSCNSDQGNKGACFSCIYLSEHVCGYHNKNLDRDILKAEIRYDKPFWE